MQLLDILECNGIQLSESAIYDAEFIRNIAKLLGPSYIRRIYLESIDTAKAKIGESLEKRIPDSSKAEFMLNLAFESNHPLGYGHMYFTYENITKISQSKEIKPKSTKGCYKYCGSYDDYHIFWEQYKKVAELRGLRVVFH